MVGESDTVSRSFSAARNGLLWFGGLLAVFVTIFVVAAAFDTGGAKPNGRNRPRSGGSRSAEEEPSMGLSPEVVNRKGSGN